MDAEEKYQQLVKRPVLEATALLPCCVYFFGSRQTGKAVRSSDYDIGIDGLNPEAFSRLWQVLDDWWEESIVPHPIDLVDLTQADEVFRAVVKDTDTRWKTD